MELAKLIVLNELYEVCEVLNLDAPRSGQFFQNHLQW